MSGEWIRLAVLLRLVAPVRVVLANLVSSTVVALLPVVARSLTGDGIAILSGMLQDERAGVRVVLATAGWRILAEDLEDQWWSVRVSR